MFHILHVICLVPAFSTYCYQFNFNIRAYRGEVKSKLGLANRFFNFMTPVATLVTGMVFQIRFSTCSGLPWSKILTFLYLLDDVNLFVLGRIAVSACLFFVSRGIKRIAPGR